MEEITETINCKIMEALYESVGDANNPREEQRGCVRSFCKNYRFSLWRIWDTQKPLAMFVGLNPSTATVVLDDPTIRRVRSISKNIGFGGFYMMNCFPMISSDPKYLSNHFLSHDYGAFQEENFKRILDTGRNCSTIIFAWGSFKEAHFVKERLKQMFPNPMALHINKDGSPKHPLYCKNDSKLIPFV